MITLYFITVLVLTTNTISEGWLQSTTPYTSKQDCEFAVLAKIDTITPSLKLYLKDKFIEVKEIECLTHDEAVKRNSTLGH
jgi:ethanolamine utilization cobalamin adenosyltransferase